MTPRIFELATCAAVMALLTSLAGAQDASRANAPDSATTSSRTGAALVEPIVPLSTQDFYSGWRASTLLNREVTSHAGHDLGRVRNILLDRRGRIQALLVERPVSNERAEFVFRLPWHRVDQTKLPGQLSANLTTGIGPELRVFGAGNAGGTAPDEFRISEVLGDYARLQAGQAYGYVNDVVFSRSGAMLAVVVVRDEAAGGGTFAFGFPGTTGAWNPHAGYYGLPYVTADQASSAALRVETNRFGQAGRPTHDGAEK